MVVISADDAGAKRVTALLKHPKVLSFGQSSGADVRVVDLDASGPMVKFGLEHAGESVAVELSVPGSHNALNAAGAVCTLVGLGYGLQEAASAVASFAGTERRFELHGEARGVKVYDDFAHHPTEVAAALQAARAVVGKGKIITVFQPHLYSRTRIFAQEFATALALSDRVVITDVYAAREDPEPGVTGETISSRFVDHDKVHYVPLWDDTAAVAAGLSEPGDFIVTMGCGDIFRMVPELLSALEKS
jgi:UDP-N-acetylmuramate--alanine ligase